MNSEEVFKIAIHCLGVQAEQEVCEECDIYGNCHTDCKDIATYAIEALKEVQQYREIGTVEECRGAVGKQRTKKILSFKGGLLYEDGWRYKCPSCGCAVGENVYHPDVTKDFEYCSMCGQKITE